MNEGAASRTFMRRPGTRSSFRACFLALAVLLTIPSLPGSSPTDGALRDDDIWERSFREGQAAVRDRDWDAAVAAFGMAVHRAEGFEADDPRLIDSLRQLSFAFFFGKKFDERLPPLIRAVELSRNSSRYHSLETAGLLEATAHARVDVGDTFEAVELLRDAIGIRESILGDTHPDLVLSLETLAEWTERRDPEEAEVVLRRAVEISRNAPGEHRRDTARLLLALGNLHHGQGRHEAAIEHYRRALEIETEGKDARPERALYPTFLLTRPYLESGRFHEAAEAYRDLITMTRAFKGPRHPDIVNLLRWLAYALRRGGEPEAAEPALREALEIAAVAWGPDHARTRGARRELNQLLADLGVAGTAEDETPASNALPPVVSDEDGRFLEEIERSERKDDLPGAIDHGRRWLESVRSDRGEDDLRVVGPLNRLATLLERRGLWEEALENRTKALEVLSLHVDEDDPAFLAALFATADLLGRLGRREEAMRYHERELSIREARGESNRDVAGLLSRMGATLQQVEPGLGEVYLYRAAQTWERIAGPDAPERSVLLLVLARSHMNRGDLATAEALLTELLARLEAREQPDTALTSDVLEQLGAVYRGFGRFKEASAVEKRRDALAP